VIDGDALGHDLLTQPQVQAAIATAFGSEVIVGDGVNRAALARRVFADPQELKRLDEIMLAPLASRMRVALAALDARGKALAVLEAAVYYLLPSLGHVDLTITVTASAETRVRRLLETGRWPADETRRRVAAQAHLEDGWARSDVIVVNEGPPGELERVVAQLLAAHGIPSATGGGPPREERS
jgi:dephospho-CoA kinase